MTCEKLKMTREELKRKETELESKDAELMKTDSIRVSSQKKNTDLEKLLSSTRLSLKESKSLVLKHREELELLTKNYEVTQGNFEAANSSLEKARSAIAAAKNFISIMLDAFVPEIGPARPLEMRTVTAINDIKRHIQQRLKSRLKHVLKVLKVMKPDTDLLELAKDPPLDVSGVCDSEADDVASYLLEKLNL